jgi:hypothetical protein
VVNAEADEFLRCSAFGIVSVGQSNNPPGCVADHRPCKIDQSPRGSEGKTMRRILAARACFRVSMWLAMLGKRLAGFSMRNGPSSLNAGAVYFVFRGLGG